MQVEIAITVFDDQGNQTHGVKKRMSKDQLILNNIGPMNFGTIAFKEMFKNLLKTQNILSK